MGHQGKLGLAYQLYSFDADLRRLTGDQVNSKRLLSTWTLHFAAKRTIEL